MSGIAESQCRAVGKRDRLAEWYVGELLERALGILHCIQRQRGLVLAETLSIGVLGILFLQVAAVLEDQFGQVAGCGGGVDASAKAITHELGQVAGVVQVRVRQYHRVECLRRDRQWLPVQLAQVLQALEQAAVDQDVLSIVAQQMLGAGDGAGTAE